MEMTLTCAVCLSLFEEPVTLPLCSHNFCRACVVACLRGAQGPSYSPPQSPEWPRRQEAEQGPAGGDDDDVSVPCPLCRKVSVLPGPLGAAALPLNTTLAEVVQLFKASPGATAGGEAREPRPAHDALCAKHPGWPLQLFCRFCCRPVCGQCVSEEHQGGCHSVNLTGALYREERLKFFSYLKEIRKIHEQLLSEVAAFKNDIETQKLKSEEMVKREFENISKTLEMKKKQFLASLESQKEKRMKEYDIRMKMKDACRKIIEKYLNESEQIANECDPHLFLEVACSLNHRMKTQIDMVQMSTRYENLEWDTQMDMDTTSVVQSIRALHLTAVNLDPFKDVPSEECVVFGKADRKLGEQKKKQIAFIPVAGFDTSPDGRVIHTRIMSISESPEFGQMSHEELRYNYYVSHQWHSDDSEKQTHALPPNGRWMFPASSCSRNGPPETFPFFFIAKASNPQSDAATCPFEVQTFPAGVPDLLKVAAPSVAVLNQYSSGAVAEQKALSAFSSSNGQGTAPSLKNEDSVLLKIPESQNTNINNRNGFNCPASTILQPDSASRRKPFFSVFPTTSDRQLSQPNKQESSISLSPSFQNKTQENQLCCEHKENKLCNSFGKKLMGNCSLTDSLPCNTSSYVPGEAGTSENKSACGKVSAKYFWESNTAPMFFFPGIVKNNWDAQTAFKTSADKTKNPSNKSQMKSKKSDLTQTSSSSNSKDLRTLMHNSSFFFMKKLTSETESNFVAREDVAHNSAANKTSISDNLTQQNNDSKNHPKNDKTEDHRQSHSECDGTSMSGI